MPKKARKLALYGMLTLKAKDNEICGLVCDMKSPKTKEANDILKKI
jgi:ribosomal protein L4